MTRRSSVKLLVGVAAGAVAMASVQAHPVLAYLYGVGVGVIVMAVIDAVGHDAEQDR